jgi:hypothetical protein
VNRYTTEKRAELERSGVPVLVVTPIAGMVAAAVEDVQRVESREILESKTPPLTARMMKRPTTFNPMLTQ